jgi:hypothetical protein
MLPEAFSEADPDDTLSVPPVMIVVLVLFGRRASALFVRFYLKCF